MHCDHTVYFTEVLLYGWIVQCSGYPGTKACSPTPSRLFPVALRREVGRPMDAHLKNISKSEAEDGD